MRSHVARRRLAFQDPRPREQGVWHTGPVLPPVGVLGAEVAAVQAKAKAGDKKKLDAAAPVYPWRQRGVEVGSPRGVAYYQGCFRPVGMLSQSEEDTFRSSEKCDTF